MIVSSQFFRASQLRNIIQVPSVRTWSYFFFPLHSLFVEIASNVCFLFGFFKPKICLINRIQLTDSTKPYFYSVLLMSAASGQRIAIVLDR